MELEKVTEKELNELDLWVRNTWNEEEKDYFYSTIFKLEKGALDYDSEEAKKLRELVVKNYEQYAENFVNEVQRQESVISDIDVKISELEQKLSNKENYLLENYPAKIKDADFTNRIENASKTIEEYSQRRKRFLEIKKTNENQKKEIEEKIATLEEQLEELRIKNVSVTTPEETRIASEKYESIKEQKIKLEELIETLENSEDRRKLEEELIEIEQKINEEEDKKARYERLKETNKEYLDNKIYDEHAIRLDEDELSRAKAGKAASENWIKNNGNTNYLEIFDKYMGKSNTNEQIEEKDELDVVVKMTPWEWIKAHKKQILIALGLTALAVSIVVLVTQLLPALVAAQQATTTAGLLSQMGINANLWGAATVGEQAALHGANTALASQISSITGMSTAFNTFTGAWTIGGQALPAATAAAAATASKAAGTVAAMKGATLIAGLGGIGSLGAGLLLGKTSDEYKRINKRIRALKNQLDELGEERFRELVSKLTDEIEGAYNSEKISKREQKALFKQLSSVLRKRAKKHTNIDEIANDDVVLDDATMQIEKLPEEQEEVVYDVDLQESKETEVVPKVEDYGYNPNIDPDFGEDIVEAEQTTGFNPEEFAEVYDEIKEQQAHKKI